MELTKINPQSYERGDFHDDVKLLSPYTVAAITAIRERQHARLPNAWFHPFFLLNLPRRYSSIFVYENK